MEIVFYSDQEEWDVNDRNPIVGAFLTSLFPICLCTQLSDELINSPNGFLAQRGSLPTRIVKPLEGQGVEIIVAINVGINIESLENLLTIATNAVDTQGTTIQAALNLFRFASGGGYPYQVFCLYGLIDLRTTLPFAPPRTTTLLKTPTSPIQVVIAKTFDAPKIFTDALDLFSDQLDSTRIQLGTNQGYLVSQNLVRYINLDLALSGTIQTYPVDVWSRLFRQYLENPYPRRSTFPLKTVFIVALLIILVTFQLRALASMNF